MKRTRQPAPVPAARDTLFSYLLGSPDLAGKKIVDLFAGGGGVSLGIELALGRSPDVAINHDPEAIAMHQVNHPLTRHYQTDVFEVDPHEAVGDAGVALLWLSPDCKHHSPAKGGAPLDQGIRSLAWVALKWAGKKQPDVIVLENVPAFEQWGRLIAKREAPKDAHKRPIWPNKPRRRGKACRRWKKGMARQQPPRGPVVHGEDGRMQLHADKRPRYQGKTFKRFKAELERLGYVVEHRTLVAADYGVPTIRERFFLIARRDGKPVVWPQQTHAEPNDPRVRSGQLRPWRTAAECIDWTIPTRSIFPGQERKKPLKDKTLRRVAMGVNKYVLGERAPFLVMCAHGGHDSRQRGVDTPVWTVTSANDGIGAVTPYLVPMNADNPPLSAERPLGTVTTGNRFYLATPYLAPRYGERPGQPPRCGTVEAPLPTVVTGANGARLVAAHITKYREGSTGCSLADPIDTITAGGNPARPGTGNVFGLVSAHITSYYGAKGKPDSRGQALDTCLNTITASNRHCLVAAHIVRHNGGGLAPQHAGYAVNEPARTFTAQGGPQALVSAALVQYNGTADAQPAERPIGALSTVERFGVMTANMLRIDQQGGGHAVSAAEAPLRTVTTKNGHAVTTAHLLPAFDEALHAQARRVHAFLAQYCPAALEKVPAEDRAQQLVTLTLDGEKYVVYDIGMRMLTPRELYRCSSFPETYQIDFSLKGKPLPKDAQVRMCGNSVPPEWVAAIVGAQFPEAMQEAAD